MNNYSKADKEYLKLLILDCETFHLSEKESIAYISNKLNRKIARTLYYNCKKEISDNDSFTHIFSDSKWEKSFSFIHDIAIRNRILNSSKDTRIRCHNAWNDPEFVDKYSDRFFVDGYALVEQTKRIFARINSQQELTLKNFVLNCSLYSIKSQQQKKRI